jgi:hypothetical protein
MLQTSVVHVKPSSHSLFVTQTPKMPPVPPIPPELEAIPIPPTPIPPIPLDDATIPPVPPIPPELVVTAPPIPPMPPNPLELPAAPPDPAAPPPTPPAPPDAPPVPPAPPDAPPEPPLPPSPAVPDEPFELELELELEPASPLELPPELPPPPDGLVGLLVSPQPLTMAKVIAAIQYACRRSTFIVVSPWGKESSPECQISRNEVDTRNSNLRSAQKFHCNALKWPKCDKTPPELEIILPYVRDARRRHGTEPKVVLDAAATLGNRLQAPRS